MVIHPPSPNTARTARPASRRLVTFRNALYERRAERRTTTKTEDGRAEPTESWWPREQGKKIEFAKSESRSKDARRFGH